MGNDDVDREAAAIGVRLPRGPRVVVIGSTVFWHSESEATCSALGASLAEIEGLVLVTGGVEGVGETTGRSFQAARTARGGAAAAFHVLPLGYGAWDYGTTLYAGRDMSERREILGRLSDLYVAIEGGPGTAHEAAVARARSAVIIPVARSGGHAGELYARVPRPRLVTDQAWRILARPDIAPSRIAAAVIEIVRVLISEPSAVE